MKEAIDKIIEVYEQQKNTIQQQEAMIKALEIAKTEAITELNVEKSRTNELQAKLNKFAKIFKEVEKNG